MKPHPISNSPHDRGCLFRTFQYFLPILNSMFTLLCSVNIDYALTSSSTRPQILLDQLARHSLNTPSTPTSLRLSCVALAYHSHLQFTRFGLLEQIQIAAGKSGSPEIREAAQIDVALQLQKSPTVARNIFAHAAMLRCLLNRFTFE